MEKITKIITTAVPLNISNIDTDQIIPARFLKSISNKGFGKNLFRDWRYKKNGVLNKNFILNNSKYNGEILIVGKNFGCGSSREHAVWAILDYGFKVVIANSFADIFKNNALNQKLLPIEIPNLIINKLFDLLNIDPNILFEIDINNLTLDVKKHNIKCNFLMDKYKQICFTNGYDDIDFLLSIKDKIINFEKKYKNISI
ncbi:MAG: 3-isopropylmalate dehydratase small subunit [Bacteroides sp.]|nr:MAG: 3-isopropylmalate dehydratase small subunit [Bacteroides sp.]